VVAAAAVEVTTFVEVLTPAEAPDARALMVRPLTPAPNGAFTAAPANTISVKTLEASADTEFAV